jgi:hypothetical protein
MFLVAALQDLHCMSLLWLLYISQLCQMKQQMQGNWGFLCSYLAVERAVCGLAKGLGGLELH